MGRTCCVQKLILTFRTIHVHNIRASDKDLPVRGGSAQTEQLTYSAKMGFLIHVSDLLYFDLVKKVMNLNKKNILVLFKKSNLIHEWSIINLHIFLFTI